MAGKHTGAWSDTAYRYISSVEGLMATTEKAGSVTATWKADSKANAGYTVLVRYARGGAVVAKTSVAKGKKRATVNGLAKGERYWVAVIPLRTSSGQTYDGMSCGTWAEGISGSSLEAQPAEVGPARNGGLIAASI